MQPLGPVGPSSCVPLPEHVTEQAPAAERPNVQRNIFIYLASAHPFFLSVDAPQFMYWKRSENLSEKVLENLSSMGRNNQQIF